MRIASGYNRPTGESTTIKKDSEGAASTSVVPLEQMPMFKISENIFSLCLIPLVTMATRCEMHKWKNANSEMVKYIDMY